MATPAQLNQAILDDATDGVAKATNDQGSVEMLSVEDRLKAAQHAATDVGIEKPHRGLRFTRLRTPGTGPT